MEDVIIWAILRWEFQLGTYSVVFFSFLLVMLPSEIPSFPQIWQWEGFPLFGNFSSFTNLSPGWVSFASLFVCYILSYLFSNRIDCLSGCPLPVFRSCFMEFLQHSHDLLMNFGGEKWSPSPIPPPCWDHPSTLFLTQDARMYNGTKTAASINGAGKLDSYMWKNEIRILPNTINNDKLKMNYRPRWKTRNYYKTLRGKHRQNTLWHKSKQDPLWPIS